MFAKCLHGIYGMRKAFPNFMGIIPKEGDLWELHAQTLCFWNNFLCLLCQKDDIPDAFRQQFL